MSLHRRSANSQDEVPKVRWKVSSALFFFLLLLLCRLIFVLILKDLIPM